MGVWTGVNACVCEYESDQHLGREASLSRCLELDAFWGICGFSGYKEAASEFCDRLGLEFRPIKTDKR